MRLQDILTPLEGARLAGYLDCGEEHASPPQKLFMVVARGNPVKWSTDAAQDELRSISYDSSHVEIDAHGLKPDKAYVLGFSWWDFDSKQRWESVAAIDPSGSEIPLAPAQELPEYLERGELPVEQAVLVPPGGIQRRPLASPHQK